MGVYQDQAILQARKRIVDQNSTRIGYLNSCNVIYRHSLLSTNLKERFLSTEHPKSRQKIHHPVCQGEDAHEFIYIALQESEASVSHPGSHRRRDQLFSSRRKSGLPRKKHAPLSGTKTFWMLEGRERVCKSTGVNPDFRCEDVLHEEKANAGEKIAWFSNLARPVGIQLQ